MTTQISTQQPTIVFFHSEGSNPNARSSTVVVNSKNLIDFILEVFKLGSDCVLVSTSNSKASKFELPLKINTKSYTIPLSTGHSLSQQLPRFFLTVAAFKRRTEIRKAFESDICVSVGLSGFGVLASAIRVHWYNRPHTFIVRGNRLLTLKTSSRSVVNKYFALFRVKLYQRYMISLVNKGRATVWFQGQNQHQQYLSLVNSEKHGSLQVLNAVLQSLPAKPFEARIKCVDLIFVGRITIEKGIRELLNAIQILNQRGIALTLNILGEGPDRILAEKMSVDLSIAHLVRFYGHVSNIDDIIKSLLESAVFVLPSYTEGLPRSMLESMYLGIPVIVTNVGGIPYVITDGVNGFTVEPKNSNKLAEKIQHVTKLQHENPNLVKQIVSNAKTDSTKYNFESRAKHFINKHLNS